MNAGSMKTGSDATRFKNRKYSPVRTSTYQCSVVVLLPFRLVFLPLQLLVGGSQFCVCIPQLQEVVLQVRDLLLCVVSLVVKRRLQKKMIIFY